MPPRPGDARTDASPTRTRATSAPRSALVPTGVVLGAALAAVAGALVGFRAAGLVLATVLALTAAARATLPASSPMVLVVRSRGVDVATAAVLALGVTLLALTAPA